MGQGNVSKLKQMIIKQAQGNVNEWQHYVAENIGCDWFCEVGLKILLNDNEWHETGTIDITRLIGYFIGSSSVSSEEVQRLLVQQIDSLSSQLDPSLGSRYVNSHVNSRMQNNWLKDRNICAIIYFIMKDFPKLISATNKDKILNYLELLFAKCKNTETLFWAILALEKVCFRNDVPIEKRLSLYRKVIDLFSGIDTAIVTGTEFDQYQTGVFASFSIKRLFCSGSTAICSHKLLLNLSTNTIEADNLVLYYFTSIYFPVLSQINFITVRSSLAIVSGVHFYEVTIFTDGRMRFGWTCAQSRLTESNGIGEDVHSIGFDTSSERVIYNRLHLNSPSRLSGWRVGDVVGCLIDANSQQFAFYLNGQVIECCQKFSSLPYFAAASFSANQQCYFNFGQTNFKYPPKDVQFSTFHQSTHGNTQRYRLLEPKKVKDHYWFTRELIEGQVQPFYLDPAQKLCDQMLLQNINDGHFIGNNAHLKVYGHLRCIQSIIEVLGENVTENFDTVALWIGEVVQEAIVDINLNSEKLIEFIFPYLTLRVHNQSSIVFKHRSICLILLNLINCCHNFLEYLNQRILIYLIKTLRKTNDIWTKLFALISIEALKIVDRDKKNFTLKNIEKIVEWLDMQQRDTYLRSITLNEEGHSSRVKFQLDLCCEWFQSKMFNSIQNNSKTDATETTLSSTDKSDHLKLSVDLLSARSDSNWQSVRSIATVDKGKYYFEVTLLTNGPMRIGWATKDTKMCPKSGQIGADSNSIGIDGYNRCVWHGNKQFKVKQLDQQWNIANLEHFSRLRHFFEYARMPQWKEGDVVGCLLDATSEKRRFHFFLNGLLLIYDQTNVHFSCQPYHSALSLSSHQQCVCNFGQSDFEHPPNQIGYSSFCNPIHTYIHTFATTQPPSRRKVDLAEPSYSQVSATWRRVGRSKSHRVTGKWPAHRRGPRSLSLCNPIQTIKNNDSFIVNEQSVQLFNLKKVFVENSIFNVCSKNTKIGNANLSQIASKFPDSNAKCHPAQCGICRDTVPTSLYRFTCCDFQMFCHTCVQIIKDCPKCSKIAKTKQQNTSRKHKPNKCQLCSESTLSTLIRFVCCGNLIFCSGCAEQLQSGCFKCGKMKS